jgi:putative (di)nucleoside polyphosphate hydrolase
MIPNYRPCVGVMLLNARGLAFVGRRRPKGESDSVRAPFEWQMPQGGVDAGEEPYAAALRELFEETNVRSVELLAEAPHWLNYDLPPESSMRWKGKYTGQTQKWFALRFTGDDGEIDIHTPGGGGHQPEFDAWRWERPSLLPGLIVPFKRHVYEEVVRAFSPFAAAG